MPIEKNVTVDDLPQGDVAVEVEENLPDISVEFDAETGEVVVGIGSEEDDKVPFDSNLAEVVDPSVLQSISAELMALFEADKSSRKQWEDQYGKGLKLLGFTFEERTKPFKGACPVQHPLLTESVIQFQAQALKELNAESRA